MSQCVCDHIDGQHDQRTSEWSCRVCMCPEFREHTPGHTFSIYSARRPGYDGVNGGAHELLDKLHEGEPVFVIRAQDILSPQALAAYAALARKLGLDAHAQYAEARAVQMLAWQASHSKLVKPPD